MPRSFRFPRYPVSPHSSGQARIRIGKKTHYLGKFNSQESRAEYARLATLYATSPDPVTVAGPDPTCTEVVAAWEQARQGSDDTRRRTLRACTVLIRLFGETLARDFDANALEVVRSAMVSGSWMTQEERDWLIKRSKPVGWCQSQCNQACTRIKKVWRWCERKGLAPKGAYAHLLSLEPLSKSSGVRRNPKRRAADEHSLEVVIPLLTPMVSAMVQLAVLTGMRPSEIVKMREDMIDCTGDVWLYKMNPDEHKTGHIDDADSTVVIGPEAQLVIFPYLDAARKAGAGSAIWRPCPSKSSHYSSAGFYRAVVRACARAGVKRVTPYQFRHLCKARIKRVHGIEGARTVLRHTSCTTTEGYDRGVDLEAAKKIARDMG